MKNPGAVARIRHASSGAPSPPAPLAPAPEGREARSPPPPSDRVEAGRASAAVHTPHSTSTRHPHINEGSLSANSLIPNTRAEVALSQAYNGGLAQNGVPGVSCGVTQLAVSSITRAISP